VLGAFRGEAKRVLAGAADGVERMHRPPQVVRLEQREDLQAGQPVRNPHQPVAARGHGLDGVAAIAQRVHDLPHRGPGQPELAGEGLAGGEVGTRLQQHLEHELGVGRVLAIEGHHREVGPGGA